MSEGLNRVYLLGNLGADPELRSTQGGTAVLNIRLATTESFKDRSGERQERTDWHSVVVWGARAEALAKILGKGARILVEGSLRTEEYEAKDGSGKRWTTKVHASDIKLCGARAPRNDNADEEEPRGGYSRGRNVAPERY